MQQYAIIWHNITKRENTMYNVTEDHMLAIYVLWTEFRLTTKEIVNIMNLPDTMIRAIIKSMRYEVSINDYSKEIHKMKQLLLGKGFYVLDPITKII